MRESTRLNPGAAAGRRAMSSLNKVGIKLALAMGLLLCLFVTAALVSVLQARIISRAVRDITEVENPTSLAAPEMEINLIGTGFGVLGYLHDRDPLHLARIQNDASDFETFQRQYHRLVETPEGVALGAKVDQAYARFRRDTEALIRAEDEQAGAVEALLKNLAELDDLLDEEIQVLSHQGLAKAGTAVQETVRRTYITVFALLLSGLVAGAFTIFAITRSVTRPVGRLVAASQRVAAGDLSQRVNMDSQDEFRILGDSFNQMVAARQEAETALQQAHGQLELRVQERTAQLAQANQTITGMNQLSRSVASTLDIGQVYERFAQQVKKLVDYDRVVINLIDQDAGTLHFQYAAGLLPGVRQVGDMVPLGGTQSGEVVATGKPLVRPDIAADVRFDADPSLVKLGIRSMIVVPLIAKGRVVGSYSLGSRRAGAYGPREQEILEQAATHLSSTVENARLYEEVQKRTQELARANEELEAGVAELRQAEAAEHRRNLKLAAQFTIAQILSRPGESQEKPTLVMEELLGIAQVDSVTLRVRDDQEQGLRLVAESGRAETQIPPTPLLPFQGSLSGVALETGQPMVVHDYPAHPFATPNGIARGVKSLLVTPVKSSSMTLGAVTFISRKLNHFTPERVELLTAVMSEVGVLLENDRLYQDAVKEKERATTALAQLNGLLESVDAGIVLVGEDHKTVLWVNQRFGEFFGVDDLESVMGDAGLHARLRSLAGRALDDPKEFFAEVDRIYQDRSYVGVTENIQLAGPQPRLVRRFTTPVHSENGDYLGRLWVYTDVTEQQRLEAQFRQSQKMEVVGRLAGGVAHDFNNLLTAILGYAQLASAQLPAGHPVAGHLQEVEKATQRAATLTRQLLTFSRHQAVEPAMADINQIIMEIHGMVRRLIGEDVELVTLPAPDLPSVKVDRGQMEQLVMNLVVNARDAMPSGGKITLQTGVVNLAPGRADQMEGISPGPYVTLAVADTGTGMSDEVKAHLFEPFFTTKEVGKGTGLGLATCYGIIRRAGGHIEVESQPGQGTTFQIYLPAQSPWGAAGSGQEPSQNLPWGTETVLLAEDEPALRALVAQTLEDLGYTVLQAADGEEGVRVARERRGGGIHLLLTDMVMPRMGGVELASRFKTEWPDARVLFVSGYSEDPQLQHSADRRDMDFMQKPFLPAALARRVRALLDRQ